MPSKTNNNIHNRTGLCFLASPKRRSLYEHLRNKQSEILPKRLKTANCPCLPM